MKILLTGGSGFVGAALAQSIAASHASLIAPSRARSDSDNKEQHIGRALTIGEINAATNWARCLKGVEIIVHCAAISEVGKNPDVQQLHSLRSVNVDGTVNLARQAASSGVRRFIFLSSIKVNGDSTRLGAPFMYDDSPLPADAYGLSKLEAERGLQNIARDTGMEFVVIRAPLVYGPGVKGNFAMLMKLVEYGVPLPLSNIRNQRSFIGVDNLVDLVMACISNQKATNQIFLASDDHDLSTPELLRRLAKAAGKPSRLFRLPPKVLICTSRILGKTGIADRLCGSLQVDISKTKHLLGWQPPITVDKGLSRCFPQVGKLTESGKAF
jgi:nucleoside-diphosphate-sugar epimerase